MKKYIEEKINLAVNIEPEVVSDSGLDKQDILDKVKSAILEEETQKGSGSRFHPLYEELFANTRKLELPN